MTNYRKTYLCICDGQQEKMYLQHLAKLIKKFPRKVVTFNTFITDMSFSLVNNLEYTNQKDKNVNLWRF
ncbi:hypothetical protein RBH29_04265 [Herbivorax sp. ANBcel31]|uniref:hypothetical protein n=1 Tax=Herbivorax sp. ANBcel31 TaxID=3069754 RepID=UPI0027AFC246|nr:hypothetical protein [Herbivorax sp. ANBcel31]MDQ2085647.1 hypothetical protein [Herbivorax sp. ANBcel31]